MGFEAGVPVRLDGTPLAPYDLISRLGELAGSRGFGRLDMVENRRVGIKSREVYECPAALALILAHADLEDLTLERDLHHEKARLEPRWSELVYDGLWYSPLKHALRGVHHREPAPRHRRGAAALRGAGHVRGGGAPQPGGALRPRTGHLRRLRHVPARGRRGLRAAVGPRRGHLVGPPGPGRAEAARRRRVDDALGGTHLDGHGRRGGGVHGQPSLRPRAGRATTWPGRVPTSRASARWGSSPTSEVASLLDALDMVEEELATGAFAFAPGDEDVHTADRAAGDRAGRRRRRQAAHRAEPQRPGRHRPAAVVPRARSSAWPTRSWRSRTCWPQRAQEAADVYLPGYTHLQRAQPVLLAHHLLAHGWALARDVDRMLATVDRLNVSPLGAGALAGSSLPLDPDYVAAELGFHGRFENSLDAVSDRDFVAEALFDLALLGVHLSRMGEEMVLWSTEEFGFATLDDAYATGSSMLPQKKNPDVAELARGKAGRLIGNLTGLLVTLKGLPLAYNRDLQEDKEPLFDAVDQVHLALAALPGVLRDRRRGTSERMQAAADGPAAAAVDLAEYAGRAGHAVPPGPRRWSAGWSASRSSATCPWSSWSRPTRIWGRPRGAARTRRGRHPAEHPGRRRPGPGGRAGGALRPAARGRPGAAGAVAPPRDGVLRPGSRTRPAAGRGARHSPVSGTLR